MERVGNAAPTSETAQLGTARSCVISSSLHEVRCGVTINNFSTNIVQERLVPETAFSCR